MADYSHISFDYAKKWTKITILGFMKIWNLNNVKTVAKLLISLKGI